MIRHGKRSPEFRHNGISFVFIDNSPLLQNEIGHLGKINIEQVDQGFRLHFFGQGSKVCEIRKEYRNDALLPSEF